jgi:pyruvate dehydrogenase E1 component beta subunit
MAVATRTLTFRQAITEALSAEMERDPTVVLMGEDVAGGATVPGFENEDAWGGVLGVTKGLVQQFGRERVLDTPISESGYIGAAVGAASTGLRPVAELMFVDFFGVCFDQIFNQGAKVMVPLVVRTTIGAGFRAAGQHSGCHYSVFTHMPGLKCVVPSTPADARGLLVAAIRDDDPVIFCEHKLLYDIEGEIPPGEHLVPLGKADVKREGSGVSVVTLGRMVHLALEAAEALDSEGVSVEVLDLRSISPMDEEAVLASVRKTRRLVVVDEDNPRCSIATDVVALAASRAFDYLDAPPQMVTAPHTPVPFSPPLEDFYVPSVDQIAAAVRATLE